MDLTLALGRPVGPMPERELALWLAYANRKALPLRRIELALAQIAQLIAITMGGAEGVTIADFLVDGLFESPDEGEPESSESDMAAVFGPRKQGPDG